MKLSLTQIPSYFTILFFLILSSVANAQQTEPKKISGMILERGTNNTRVADVNVTNLNTNAKTTTNSQGIFSIAVMAGDSLSFSKVGYGPIKTRIDVYQDIILDMQAGLEIETVVVSRNTREGELRDAYSDYQKKGIYNGGHNKASTYLANPATALYNLFGKQPRNARRFEEYMNKEVDAMKVDRIFSKKVVGEISNLEGQELSDFMAIYRPSLHMVERWGEYDLMVYITNSLESWKKNGKPRPVRLPKLEIEEQEK